MGSTPGPGSQHPRSAVRAVAWAGLLCGVLDLAFVIFYYHEAGPQRILQSVAAGLLGRTAATQGGWPTALLGLFLHFVIAYGAAGVFYAASRRLGFLVRQAPVSGVLYGAAVWLFMQLVVLRLSAVPPKSFPPPNWLPVFLAHLTCVGPPIALAVRRFGPPPR